MKIVMIEIVLNPDKRLKTLFSTSLTLPDRIAPDILPE
jgi:hypothetical protein